MGVRKNRRFRRNPYTASNPTVTDYGPIVGANGNGNGNGPVFDSITKARAFLKEVETLERVGELPSDIQHKIEAAEEMIRKADLRNVRRQLKRYQKRGLTPPPELIDRYNSLRAKAAFYPQPERYVEPTQMSSGISARKNRKGLNGCTPLDRKVDEVCNGDSRIPLRDISDDCLDVLQRRRDCISQHKTKSRMPARRVDRLQHKSSIRRPSTPAKRIDRNVAYWEEVMGPEGETIRFLLSFDESGKFSGRRPTKYSPQVGDVVLDLTAGIKAWVIKKGRRRPTAVTSEMRRIYENSCLYKTRQLAAGQLDLATYQDEVNKIGRASYK